MADPHSLSMTMRNAGARRAAARRGVRLPAPLLAVALALAGAFGSAAAHDRHGELAGERILLRIDADPAAYCFYDGRPFSEGAYVDSPRGVLVCTLRARDPATGETFLPAEGDRRLRWLPADPPGQ